MRQRIWQIFVIILVLVNLISAGGAGATPALAANPAAPAFALSFTPEVVDNNAISGQYSSIALDAEGVAHIAYFYDDNDGTPDGILMMASRHGGTWLSEPVDGASITGVTPSIAIDEDGMAHIAYYDQTNGDLRYAKQRTPDGWDYHTVDSPGNVGANCALALDSLQRPHIAYRDATNSTLKYATFNGTTWQISTIPGTSDFTYDSSIGLGLTSADLPRIAYRQMNGQIPKALGYVQFNGTSWSVEAALTSTAVGDRFSLVMGAGDVPHISFMDTSVGLKYMKKDGAWSTPETVVASVNAGSLNSLALDPAGRPRIVYLDATAMPYLLKIAYKDGATWRLELLANTATSPDLVIGVDGSAHISYQNANNKQGYIPLSPFPDVQVSDIWLDGSTIHFQVLNSGSGAAPVGLYLNLLVGGVRRSNTTLTDPIPAGGRLNSSFSAYTLSCTVGTTFTVTVDADPGSQMAELTRSNNTRSESWKCKGVKPTITSGPTVTGITPHAATINWTTSTATDSLVTYERRTGFLDPNEYKDVTVVTSHSVTLSSLAPAASYAFKVTSMDQSGQSVSSDVAFFTTSSPGGTVSQAVVRTITKNEGPGEVFTLKAAVPTTAGLEKVDFFYQLTPTSPLVLIGTAFSGTPATGGVVEYATTFSPGLSGLSRQQLNSAKIVTQVSLLGGSTESFENVMEAMNPLEPEVVITAPNPNYTIFIQGSSVPSNTIFIAKAHAMGFEWECSWSGGGSRPDCEDVIRKPTKFEWTFRGSLTTISDPVSFDFEKNFDIGGAAPGTYPLTATAWYGTKSKSASINILVATGTPQPSLTRTVERIGNRFRVNFTLSNHASASGNLVFNGLYDYVRGFQPIFDDEGDVKVTSTYTPSTRINQVYIDIDSGASEWRTLPAGGSFSFYYDLIPILYENDVQYAIGEVNVTSLIYKVVSDERFQYFNLPGSTLLDPSPAVVTLAASVAKALKLDDYVLVTHPANLKSVYGSQTAEPNWNTLLRRMAELADIRQGALGYLDSQDAEKLNGLLEPKNHAWTDKLHPNFSKYAQGYVLLVGEDNIVPSYTKTGLLGGTVKLTDNPLAHTGGSGAPDLVLGRLPGNDIPQLIKPIVTSLKVLRGQLVNYRSKALGTSGTGDGIQGFQDSAQSVKSNLQNLGVTVSLYHEEEKARTAKITVPFDDGDLLAAGDINGDGAQELIIGDVSTDDIYVVFITSESYTRIKLFHFPEDIQSGHGFAMGDLDGDLKDELVIGDDSNRIFVYKCESTPCDESHPPALKAIIPLAYDNWDKLAVGDVIAGSPKRDEIIFAHAGMVTILDGQLGTVLGSFAMAFSDSDDMTVGQVWDNNAVEEIVLMRASQDKGYIYSATGSLFSQFNAVYSSGDFVITADVDGDAGDAKPDEVWVLNSAGDAIQGYYQYGDDPKAIYIPQRVIAGDKIAVLKLPGESRPSIWLVKRDDNTYQLDRDYPKYIQTLYINTATDADYLYYRGHGSSTSWESINAGMLPVPEFGNAAPLAYGTTCLSGDYSTLLSASMSERMLWWGAGAFIGSTEVSYGDFNVNAAIWMSNHLKDAGPFARLLLEYKNKKWDDGTNYDNCDWPYWVHEYNFYGDAKFGFIGDTTQLPYPDAAPRLAGSATLNVTLPAYTVTQKDGYDYVDIPDGDVTTTEGELRIPYYVVTEEYPAGTRVSGVTLSTHGGKTTASGLILPPYVAEIDGQARPLPNLAPQAPSAPDEIDWTPTQEQVFNWTVVERADGSSQLVIRLHPFYYSPATTAVEYYTSYSFNVETNTTKQEITRLAADKAIYRLNEPVRVDARIKNNSSGAVDLLVSATLFNAGNTPVSGADMRLLNGLAGDSSTSFTTAFDTNALPAGSYYVQMEIRTPAGAIIDTETVELELGMRAALVDVSATPSFFKIGNPVALQLTVTNAGDLLLTGAVAEVVVLDAAGVVVATYSQPVPGLAAGASTSLPFVWDTSGTTKQTYTVEGRVRYNNQSSPVDAATLQNHARFFLPTITRQ